MLYRFLFILSCGAALLSGCAFFSSEEANDRMSEERVETNAPPVTVTSLPVADRPSPNFDKRTLPVSLIVLHYTAAPLKESLNHLRNGHSGTRVSCHYVVAENGTIYRLVDESNRAWHAGASRWKDISDVNSASIGIEMVNPGHDRFGCPRPYPLEQVEVVTQLCLDIQARHDITDVVGHSDVAPTRKIDPGELFPWRKLYDRGVKVSARGFVPMETTRGQ